ncbi:MAG: cytochrome c biogenesis protein ResB, partial [Ottowia sp.]|nr:cytochrome c biogenesis protein ResB [Ottowia sp.]
RIVRKSTGDWISGRMGAANKLGYIFAHGAIVMICLGALLDSDFFMHAQLWWGDKKPMASQEQNLLLADIPAQSRLAQSNPSFRASLFVPEGKNTAAAVLTTREGILVQDLPFTLQLNQFVVEYYSTGMPKSFVSEVVLTDRQTGEQMPAKIAVNHPLIYKGIAIYQSSFEDGGSQLDFTAYPLIGAQRAPFKLSAEVGGQRQIKSADGPLMAEFTDFRAINVENIMDAAGREDVRGVVSRVSQLQAHLGAATKSSAHTLRNMGPSVHYKLRDASGQAREFHNYMLPVMLDGVQVLLAGVRSSPGDAFQYLRIPVDEQGTPQEWLHLHAALADPNMRAQAAKRYAKHFPNEASSRGLMRAQLEASALRMLALFAGGDTDDKAFPVRGGFSAIAQLIDQRVPLADQERSVEILMQVLNGSLIELWQLVRAKNGLPPAGDLPEQRAFMGVAMNALSDSFLYAAPMLLQLDNFREVKASVFQVTRTPGKYIVYLGCLFLVIGVFSMFYIRERQLWVWVKDHGGTGSEIVMACLAHRKTIDFDNEFADLHMRLAQVAQATLRTE